MNDVVRDISFGIGRRNAEASRPQRGNREGARSRTRRSEPPRATSGEGRGHSMKLRPEALAQRARELAISEGITIREAYKELGRRAGKASVAKRKQLSIQPTLPVVLTRSAHFESHLARRADLCNGKSAMSSPISAGQGVATLIGNQQRRLLQQAPISQSRFSPCGCDSSSFSSSVRTRNSVS